MGAKKGVYHTFYIQKCIYRVSQAIQTILVRDMNNELDDVN